MRPSSTIRIYNNVYSAHSRLIGEKIEARQKTWKTETWLIDIAKRLINGKSVRALTIWIRLGFLEIGFGGCTEERDGKTLYIVNGRIIIFNGGRL